MWMSEENFNLLPFEQQVFFRCWQAVYTCGQSYAHRAALNKAARVVYAVSELAGGEGVASAEEVRRYELSVELAGFPKLPGMAGRVNTDLRQETRWVLSLCYADDGDVPDAKGCGTWARRMMRFPGFNFW